MSLYRFTLVVDASELTDDLADALFEAGCDDGRLVNRMVS